MKIIWQERHQREALCPVCGCLEALDLLRVEQAGTNHDYVRCLTCRSVYPLNFEDLGQLGGYTAGRAENDMGLKHYVEIGAGIDSLIAPVLDLVDQPQGALLDVGCGFGFLPSFWDGYSEATFAHGIELASYGHWGREILGAPISHRLLAENDDVRARKYDYVWSGEVIEHVPDPAQFIADLSDVLKLEGILILSTPDADCVTPETPPADLAAALSVGAHRFLLSEKAFRRLVNDAGFGFVSSAKKGTTLIIWASRTGHLQLGAAQERAYQLLESYLHKLSLSENSWLRGGALYRLFKLLVNSGRFEEASQIERRLTGVVEAAMGPQSTWRDEIYKIIRPGAISTHQFIENAPAYLGPFLHYRGMLKLNSGNDYFSAAADFDLALRINSYAVEYHVAIAQEAGRLIASCIFHRQLAINIANKDTALFRELAKTNDPEGAAHFEPRFEREIVWSA